MSTKNKLAVLAATGTIAIASIGISGTSSAADFYKGRTVTMLIGGSVGGGYDTLARGIVPFLAGHIPGKPTIVSKNMPGGGGVVAMNYLYNNAPKDGSEVALVANNTPFEPLFGNKNAKYDGSKFNWLGTPSFEVGIVLLWHTVPVNSVADLRTHQITVGASGSVSGPAFFARALNAVLGTKMKIVVGYEGLNAVFLAMERGEVEGTPSVFYSALTSTRPTWLPQKLAKAIVQYGPEPLKELAGVPLASDLVTNPEDKALLKAAMAPLALGRPLVMPPGVPADRVETIRKALAETFADPAFKQHAEKIGLIVDHPRTGKQLQEEVAQAYQASPRIIERLRKLQAGD
jgi:tripartite-type tricarboxylate transporter receptor subunit TctC